MSGLRACVICQGNFDMAKNAFRSHRTATDIKSHQTQKKRSKSANSPEIRAKNKFGFRSLKNGIIGIYRRLKNNWRDYQARRPHRSFRHTPAKINHRPLEINGYFAFSHSVLKQLWSERAFFIKLMVILILAGILMVGIMPQATYDNFKTALDSSYETEGKSGTNVGGVLFKSSLLLISTLSSGGFNSVSSEMAGMSITFLAVVAWLATTWYLRERIAKGVSLRLRDVLYRCCAPIIPLALVSLYILIQLVPLLIVLIFYSAALTTDFATSGVGAMLLHGVMFLTVVLTIYWVEGSFLALAVVTNRGFYPMQAVKIAGDMAVGRRLKILLRLLWHAAQLIGLWIIFALPVVLAERWLSAKFDFLQKIPIVPSWVAFLTIVSLIWTYVYVYLFYRKIVEDESQPA